MSGRTFVEAFTAKYLEEEEEEEETDFGADSGIVIMCPKSKPGAHTFLRQIVLDRSNISSAGDVKGIADKLQRVTELDLSANQLGSWHEVEAVIKFMPNLEFLNLASSDLSNTPHNSDLSGCSDLRHQTVKVLILNATSLSWSSVLFILSSFPSVTEVHLSLNQLSSIPAAADDDDVSPCFKSVRKLYFNDNMVTQWSEISKLGQYFPNVENLLLVKNPLSGLTEDIGGHFACLKQLSILDTSLSSWEEIDNLNHFPKLSEIQLRGNPLLKGLEEKISRQLVVARLPNVTKLNNSTISAPEREDAERAFIRKFMDEPEKPKRYHELSAVHKNVHRFAQVDMTIKTNACLTVKYKEKTDQMTVSTEQTCLQLKKSLASHFGVSSAKIRLIYKTVKGDSEPEVLDTRTAHLQWYNMQDGDEIVVEDKPEKQDERQINRIKYSTFVDAFKAKYIALEDLQMLSKRDRGAIILAPKDYQNIKQIVLSNMHLYGTGDCQPIADKLKDITDLDISSNVLGCWTEVASMIKFMPKLEVLNLSGTVMNYIQEDLKSARQQEQFRSVKVAILNGTCLRWPYFLYALSSLPCVEEVHFGVNHLPSISPPADNDLQFASVRKLFLTSNILQNWSELVHVGKLFPGVETLHLGGNPLSDLQQNVGENFPSLVQLNIQDTYLSTWEEIDNLNYFPKLERVDLKGITLFDDLAIGGKLPRQLLVARLPKVKRLDNSSISESERDLAEQAFIQHYADAPEKPARYAELVAIHQNLPPSTPGEE